MNFERKQAKDLAESMQNLEYEMLKQLKKRKTLP